MISGFGKSKPWRHNDEQVEKCLKKGYRLQYKILVKRGIIPMYPQEEVNKMIKQGVLPDSFESLYIDDTDWDTVYPSEVNAVMKAFDSIDGNLQGSPPKSPFGQPVGFGHVSSQRESYLREEKSPPKKKKEKTISKVEFESIIMPEKFKDEIKISLVTEKDWDTKIIFNKLAPVELFEKGRGCVMLFYGDSGTGKTMTAEAISNYLQRDLMLVSSGNLLGGIVGSTENNITKLFEQAQKDNQVLVIDEIDGLITKKSNADQQYQVSAINHLMKEIERYPGVCILTTNCRAHLDPSIERRVTLKLRFERPTEEQRKEIWKRLLHPGLELASDVSIDVLAKKDLTGGQIKNIVLGAIKRSLYYKSKKITYMHIKPCIEKEIEAQKDRRVETGGME